MTSAMEDVAADATNALVYLDRRTQRLWKFGPLGEGTVLADFSDVPGGMSAPRGRCAGRIAVFAPKNRC